MKVYEGLRAAGDIFVLADGVTLDPKPSLKIRNHSPDGFAWGYMGSGPSQLALAILLDYYGDAEKAERLYMRFKEKIIAQYPQDANWTLTGDAIERICDAIDKESIQ